MRIRIGPIEYTVREVPDLHGTSRKNKKQLYNGLISYEGCVISVEQNLPDQSKIAVMWHEAIHGVLYQAGHAEHGEELVLALGYGVMQLVRDNPDLVDLTRGDALITPSPAPPRPQGGEASPAETESE